MRKTHLWLPPLIMLLVLFACEKEFTFTSRVASRRDLGSEIERVRAWYEVNKPQMVQTRSGMGNDEMIVTAPYWKEAFLRENDEFETVEVSAAMNKRLTFLDPAVRSKYLSTKNESYKQDMRRFVFLRDKKTGREYCFVMLIVPDLEYLEATNFNPFRENTYLERDDDFSGRILYYELDGSFANGYRYEDGAVVRTITDTDERLPADHPLVQTRGIDCSGYALYQLIEQCTDHYYYTEYSSSYSHTTCNYWYEYQGTYIECNGNTGGGVGGGGYVPGDNQNDPSMGEYGSIYSNSSSLTAGQKGSLYGAFHTLTTNRPIYDKLLKELKDRLVRITFKVWETVFVDGQWASAIYKLDRSITFLDDGKIRSEYLEEELIHAVQHVLYGTEMSDRVLNFEIEARMFRDIVKYRCYAPGQEQAIDSFMDPNYLGEYTKWIEGFYDRRFEENDFDKVRYFAEKCGANGKSVSRDFKYSVLKKYLINYSL